MIVLIDNYDSFVYNLARYVGRLGRARTVIRHDAATVNDIAALEPEAIILSPGPCSPNEAGICNDVIRELGPHIPILGVCLGHQCIGQVYGGTVTRAPCPVHGKTGLVSHDGTGLFAGLPQPLAAARYHSLIVTAIEHTGLSADAFIDDIIMAVHHNTHPVYGVQFHPESVLTDDGLRLMENFMALADEWNRRKRAAA